jgi:hypothetical protein
MQQTCGLVLAAKWFPDTLSAQAFRHRFVSVHICRLDQHAQTLLDPPLHIGGFGIWSRACRYCAPPGYSMEEIALRRQLGDKPKQLFDTFAKGVARRCTLRIRLFEPKCHCLERVSACLDIKIVGAG